MIVSAKRDDPGLPSRKPQSSLADFTSLVSVAIDGPEHPTSKRPQVAVQSLSGTLAGKTALKMLFYGKPSPRIIHTKTYGSLYG